MPDDEQKVPAGWTVAAVEEYKEKTIEKYFVYLCPDHKLVTAARQVSLFDDAGDHPGQPEGGTAA